MGKHRTATPGDPREIFRTSRALPAEQRAQVRLLHLVPISHRKQVRLLHPVQFLHERFSHPVQLLHAITEERQPLHDNQRSCSSENLGGKVGSWVLIFRVIT